MANATSRPTRSGQTMATRVSQRCADDLDCRGRDVRSWDRCCDVHASGLDAGEAFLVGGVGGEGVIDPWDDGYRDGTADRFVHEYEGEVVVGSGGALVDGVEAGGGD